MKEFTKEITCPNCGYIIGYKDYEDGKLKRIEKQDSCKFEREDYKPERKDNKCSITCTCGCTAEFINNNI